MQHGTHRGRRASHTFVKWCVARRRPGNFSLLRSRRAREIPLTSRNHVVNAVREFVHRFGRFCLCVSVIDPTSCIRHQGRCGVMRPRELSDQIQATCTAVYPTSSFPMIWLFKHEIFVSEDRHLSRVMLGRKYVIEAGIRLTKFI